jgi:hypothetical protein
VALAVLRGDKTLDELAQQCDILPPNQVTILRNSRGALEGEPLKAAKLNGDADAPGILAPPGVANPIINQALKYLTSGNMSARKK